MYICIHVKCPLLLDFKRT